MPRSRPSLSITLPKNFVYHVGDPQPTTPNTDHAIPPQPAPPANRHHGLKQRSRPHLATLFTDPLLSKPLPTEVPVPTIENSVTEAAAWTPRYLRSVGSSIRIDRQQTPGSPRTPKARSYTPLDQWLHAREAGEGIIRPSSTCSVLSDSSGTSVGSLVSFPAADGSCTSPESEASMWGPSSIGGQSRCDPGVSLDGGSLRSALPTRIQSEYWTADMDRHLWSTYLIYLQDPTNTPFKMLPGVAPPLGVCHRVAREAKKSWPRTQMRKSSLEQSSHDQASTTRGTAAPLLGPSNANILGATPYHSASRRASLWPKSGSSTRRRLRHLCKVQPVIAPHYQRLLQSRSPSPFSSSSRSFTRSVSQLAESVSPSQATPTATFNTRDVQLSLTTSTADTMQPNGPLAQLAIEEVGLDTSSTSFNEPPVPFASDISIPSDIESPSHHAHTPMETPRLGSPFAFHTWGPSRSNQRLPRQQTAFPASGFATVRSTAPTSSQAFRPNSLNKRRAPSLLESDLFSCTDLAGAAGDVTKLPTSFSHRRVKSRGLGAHDSASPHPLQSLFNAPSQDINIDAASSRSAVTPTTSVEQASTTPSCKVENLGNSLESPFVGISQRPKKKANRQFSGVVFDSSKHDPRNRSMTLEQFRTQCDNSEFSASIDDTATLVTSDKQEPGFGSQSTSFDE